MNILVLVQSLEKGGRTQRVTDTCQGLRERGHCVELVSLKQPPDWVVERYSRSPFTVMPRKPRLDLALLKKLTVHCRKKT